MAGWAGGRALMVPSCSMMLSGAVAGLVIVGVVGDGGRGSSRWSRSTGAVLSCREQSAAEQRRVEQSSRGEIETTVQQESDVTVSHDSRDVCLWAAYDIIRRCVLEWGQGTRSRGPGGSLAANCPAAGRACAAAACGHVTGRGEPGAQHGRPPESISLRHGKLIVARGRDHVK